MSLQHEADGPRMEFDLHFRAGRRGRRELAAGPAPEAPDGREGLPRVTRLLALAHRWNDLLERGEVQNQADIARLMGITEARVSQIMNLAYLAPTVQAHVLHPPTMGKPCSEMALRKLSQTASWGEQESAYRDARQHRN